MIAINLFSELHKPTQNIPVPVVGDELNYSLFYNSEQEKRVIETVDLRSVLKSVLPQLPNASSQKILNNA